MLFKITHIFCNNFTNIYINSVSKYSGTPGANAFAGDRVKTETRLGSTFLTNNGLGGGIDDFKFYNRDKKLFYPYDIQRFIFPYLIENNILNFVLIDSDFMFYNDESLIEKFFNRINPGILHTTFQGNHPNRDGFVKFFNELVIPNFKQIDFPTNDFKMMAGDGFFRGFHFKNIQDMKLFFEVWNQTIEKLFTSEKYNFYITMLYSILTGRPIFTLQLLQTDVLSFLAMFNLSNLQ